MELDAMQALWARQGEQMEQLLLVNQRLLRLAQQGAVQRPLRRFVAMVSGGIVLAVMGMGWLAPWIWAHWAEPEFAIPGAALYAWLLGATVFAVQQIVVAWRMDWSRPVLELQRGINELRVFRLRGVKWALWTGQVVWWTPALVVLAKAGAGVDLYAVCGWPFLALNLAFSLAVVPLAMWADRRWGQLWERSLVGYSLGAAVEALRELEEFGNSDGAV